MGLPRHGKRPLQAPIPALLCERMACCLYESSLAAPLGTWHHGGSVGSPPFNLLFVGFCDVHGLGSPHMVWAHNKRWAGKAEGIEWPVAQMPWPNLFFLDAPFPCAKLAFGPHGDLPLVRAIPWSRESVLFANSAISSTHSRSIHKLLIHLRITLPSLKIVIHITVTQ